MTKLDQATLTAQGQISIPKKVREELHLHKGDRILFMQDSKGHIFIEPSEEALELTRDEWDLFLKKTEKETVTRVHGKSQALGHLDRLMKKK